MSYRATAVALAQRAPGNYLGVALYTPMGGASAVPWWDVVAFTDSKALEAWHAGIVEAPTRDYYYLAAFDKLRSAMPIGESIGAPGFDTRAQWRLPPFQKPRVPTVSGATNGRGFGGPSGVAKAIGLFAVFAIPAGLLVEKHRASKQLREERAAFRRLGLDWNGHRR